MLQSASLCVESDWRGRDRQTGIQVALPFTSKYFAFLNLTFLMDQMGGIICFTGLNQMIYVKLLCKLRGIRGFTY